MTSRRPTSMSIATRAEFELDAFAVGEPNAEAFAGIGIIASDLDAALGKPEPAHAMSQPGWAESELRDLQPSAFSKKNCVGRHDQTVEFHLAMTAVFLRSHDPDAPHDAPAGLVLVEEKGGEAVARVVGCAGDQRKMRGTFPTGDEPFAAGDPVGAVRLLIGTRLDHTGIRAAARRRFGHREGGADLAAHDRPEPALLLRRCSCCGEHHHVAIVGRGAVEDDRTENRAVHRLVAHRHADTPDA